MQRGLPASGALGPQQEEQNPCWVTQAWTVQAQLPSVAAPQPLLPQQYERALSRSAALSGSLPAAQHND